MWCVTILSSLAIGRNAQGRVASPRRPRFVVGGLGTPVRSEIGPYQTLAEGATMPQAPEAFFGCGYAALGAMQARSSVSVYGRKASLHPDDLANAARIREIGSEA